jgi:hypothetical protein
VRDRMFAAMVRAMLERTKRTIRAEDVQGVKELRKLGPLLRVATGLQACRSTELELCRYMGRLRGSRRTLPERRPRRPERGDFCRSPEAGLGALRRD